MSRLPYLKPEHLDATGTELWDFFVETRGGTLVNDHGGLAGPFGPWLHAPRLGSHLAELGTLLRFETSVERRLLEVAIITTGAHWKAEFEWWAHARMARQHGVSDEVIDALAAGDDPPFERDDERIVHEVARQLASRGRIDDDTYVDARALLGDRGLVEIVSLCGYYTLVSFTLNAFEVPLPPGVQTVFE